MITIKSKAEFEIMRRAGRLVAETLDKLQSAVKPGISTADLDRIAYEHITRSGGTLRARSVGLVISPVTTKEPSLRCGVTAISSPVPEATVFIPTAS